MGQNLTLLPLQDPRSLTLSFVMCLDCLRFDRDYAIFKQLICLYDDSGREPTIKAIPIPPQMWVWIVGEHKDSQGTREDKHGNGLTFVYAQQLKQLEVVDNTSVKNKAIKAYINALPDDTPFILYWS
ncbi:MAG: hypothetical protein U0487_00075 [Patescibacteria group bacterium]